jgi:hypothetical protein
MRKLVVISLISVLAIANEANVTNSDMAIAKEGVKYIKILGKTLKQNVGKRLKADPSGVEAAKFCSTKAKEIAKEAMKDFPKNIKIRRTALKYRNENNKPDVVDEKVLKEMEAALKARNLKKKPIVVDVNGTKRVYVPVFVEKACTKCHGDIKDINPKVKEIISKAYPNDKAIGFKVGDLRGAMVAEIKPKK